MTIGSVRRMSIASFALALLSVPTVFGQGVEVGLMAGVYQPVRNTIEQSDGTSAKQKTAVALGARLSAGTDRKIGFDGTVAYVPSDVEASMGATGGPANLLLVSARAVLALGAPNSPSRLYLAAGPAVVVRNGEFYDGFQGTTDVGANAGLGFRFPLGSLVGRVEAETYVYSVNLKGAGNLSTGSELQADVIISATLALPLGP